MHHRIDHLEPDLHGLHRGIGFALLGSLPFWATVAVVWWMLR